MPQQLKETCGLLRAVADTVSMRETASSSLPQSVVQLPFLSFPLFFLESVRCGCTLSIPAYYIYRYIYMYPHLCLLFSQCLTGVLRSCVLLQLVVVQVVISCRVLYCVRLGFFFFHDSRHARFPPIPPPFSPFIKFCMPRHTTAGSMSKLTFLSCYIVCESLLLFSFC